MDFFDMFGFAVFMGIRDYNREVQTKKQKAAQFYQKCIEEIADELTAAFELISGEAERANPNRTPNDVLLGCSYIGLYGCGLVLQAQPTVSAEQDKLLILMFRSLRFPFSKDQFLSALRTSTETYRQFIDVIGITNNRAGSFWVAFFQIMYKNGTDQKLLAEILRHFSNIVMRFAILGHPESQVALPIVERVYKAVDAQIVACRNLPDDDVDLIGVKPYTDHYLKMKRLFDGLLRDSHPEADGIEQETFLQLFEYMLLNNISDLVMACSRGTEAKLKMIDEVLDSIPLSFSMDAGTFINKKSNNPEFQSLIYDTIVTTDKTLGKFWFFILIFGDKTSRQEDCLSFAKAYMGMMCGIETELAKQYPYSGFGWIATDQAMPIIAGMGRAYA